MNTFEIVATLSSGRAVCFEATAETTKDYTLIDLEEASRVHIGLSILYSTKAKAEDNSGPYQTRIDHHYAQYELIQSRLMFDRSAVEEKLSQQIRIEKMNGIPDYALCLQGFTGSLKPVFGAFELTDTSSFTLADFTDALLLYQSKKQDLCNLMTSALDTKNLVEIRDIAKFFEVQCLKVQEILQRKAA